LPRHDHPVGRAAKARAHKRGMVETRGDRRTAFTSSSMAGTHPANASVIHRDGHRWERDCQNRQGGRKQKSAGVEFLFRSVVPGSLAQREWDRGDGPARSARPHKNREESEGRFDATAPGGFRSPRRAVVCRVGSPRFPKLPRANSNKPNSTVPSHALDEKKPAKWRFVRRQAQSRMTEFR